MKLIHKAYKFRIYPDKEQKILLGKQFGCCRFVYNFFLNKIEEAYALDKTNLNFNDLSKILTGLRKQEEYSWLKEVNCQVLQQSLRHLNKAYFNFFKKQNRIPKFHKKSNKQSFTVPQHFKIKDNQLFFPKFSDGLRINITQEIKGKICFITVSKTSTDKYFATFTCETEHEQYEPTSSVIGIDTGIKDLAILSDGTKYENIRSLKKRLKKVKFEHRQLSKKKKGSNSRKRQCKKLAKVYEKITNVRKDWLHKVSTEIVKNHDIICIETLSVKNMVKNHKLAQALNDVSLGTFYAMLNYKANWNDKIIVKIDRFFPSSKRCNHCGWIKEDLTLNDREWKCSQCGDIHDRDLNASLNILEEGLNILSGCGSQSDIKQKRVESLPLGEALKPDVVFFLKETL